jgi:transposase
MPRIPIYKRELVLQHNSDGHSVLGISQLLGISRGAVRNILKKQQQGFPVSDKPKTGRPAILSARLQRSLVIASKKDPFKTARDVRDSCNLQKTISVDTAKRILRHNGLFGRISAPKPALTAVQKKKRLRWCKQHLNKDTPFWSTVLFSDESRFELKPKTKKIVRRPRGKRLSANYTTGTSKFSPSIMVWGAIRSDGAKVLELCQGNVNSIEYQRILDTALPSIYTRRHLFQQDGATCHTSASSRAYFQRKKVKLLDSWPPQSPDLNVIENLWDCVKRKVESRAASNLDELWECVLEEWERIPATNIQKLFHSIPDRVRAVVKNNGGQTRY